MFGEGLDDLSPNAYVLCNEASNEGRTEMQLQLDAMGRITADFPAVFFRVSTWAVERRVADFTNEDEAKMFAITDAREKGCRYDHKVSTMKIARR